MSEIFFNIVLKFLKMNKILKKYKFLNVNSITLAWHFQHWVSTFFKEILVITSGTLSKAVYYGIRIQFHVGGSPHVHSFLWVLNQHVLFELTIDIYIDYLDSVVTPNLLLKDEDPELFNLEQSYHVHSHPRIRIKNKNKSCRFRYGCFLFERTI